MDEQRYLELCAILPVEERRFGNEWHFSTEIGDIQRFLGSTRDRTNYAKDQIDRGRFVENKDYIVFALKGENPKGGRPAALYYFTENATKKICMMSETGKGDEVREYFLEMERRAKGQGSQVQIYDIKTMDQWFQGFGLFVHQGFAIIRSDIKGLKDVVEGYGFEIKKIAPLQEEVRRNREEQLRYQQREDRRRAAAKNYFKQIKFPDHVTTRFQEIWTGHDCMLCGEKDLFRRRRAQWDHVIPSNPKDPTVPHGTNTIDNLGLICKWCNNEKLNNIIHDYRPPWLIDALWRQAREWIEETRRNEQKKRDENPLLFDEYEDK